MASILDEIKAEVEAELSQQPQEEKPASVLEDVKQEVSAEPQQAPVEEPPSDFFESAERWLEPAPTQKSSGDIFLGLISNKRSNELDDEEKGLFNALSDDEQYKVAQARKDIPLDDAQARRIFEVEKSKMPSIPTSWEDWYNLGGDAWDVVKNVSKIPIKVGLGAAEFGRDVVKATDMTVSDEEAASNIKKAQGSFYSFMAPAMELPEDVLWAATKAKEGGLGWADAAGEKLGLVTPEDRFERWKTRRLVTQAQAEYFREHPTIYGRLLDSPLAKDALAGIAKWEMESPEELAKRTNISIEEAKAQQDAMAREQIDKLTSEMESELPEEKARVRIAGEFLLPGEVGMGTMGAVSIAAKGAKNIAQGLKYIGKSADEINEINKAAQALRRSEFATMLKKRTERAEAVAQGAGKIEKAIERFKPAAEKVNKVLGNITAPVLGGVAGYSVSQESPTTGILTGIIGGAATRGLLKGTKVGLEIPTFVREVAEARKVAPLGKTFETLGKSAEGSALKAKILSRGGKTIDNILSNSVEYAKSGIHGTTLALATGALESADPEEMKQMLADGLAITLGGRALQHIKGKMMGNDPIIEQRERISDDSRIHRRYQEADPETQANLDQISDFDNAISARETKLNESESDLANLMAAYKGSAEDAQKIKLAQSEVEKNKIALDQVKRANVQTRNEFGREFLKTYANLQDITNGVMKSGQNNVGFNVLSTDQIYQKLRNDPANSNVPDADLAQMASQAGFYSNPAQQGLAFDRRKPSIVINADSIRERIKLFGESPTEALVHETSHFMDVVPEFQEALAPVRSMLFQNEIRDAAGNIKATTSGIFSKAKLVELFNDGYLRHLDPQGREAFSKLNKLWDESRGQLDENKVANYMKSEVMADLLGEVSSRHLSNDLDSATLAMWDRARIKAKKNLLDRAINRFYGLGGRGDIVTAANTRAEFPPEAMAAARDAMRQIVSLNGEISPPAQEADMPKISKAQMMKNSALIERFGKDSPLFKTEFKVKVFDKDKNQVGESVPVATPNPSEGTFQSTDVGMKKLSGYGDIPAEAQGLQVPEGGTLVVSRDLVMEEDGVTPVTYEPKDAKKIDADRKKLITEALDTDDYGTPNRFEPVAEGSETYRGTFTPAQIQAIKDMPESLVPRTLKEHMLKVNDAIARGDGTRFIVDYAAVMNDKGKYQAFSPKMYDLVPIGMHLSKKGNFLVTTISVGRIFDKMRLWNERMPGRLRFWDNNLERTFDDFSKYLNNWQQGKAGETGLDADPQVALQKKNIFNDLLNLYDKGTEFTNLDRTTIPRKKGDPRNKDANRTIMSIRVDHIAELISNENATKLPVNYGFAKINFMPERMEGDVAETQEPITQTERFPTPERGFYSGLQQTIDQKVQGKFASPDQIKAIVSNPQNVKAEELKWSGVLGEIDRLAAENNGKVPKDKVMEYLRNEGAVKFEEVTLGGATKTWTQSEIDALERQAQRTRNFDAYEQAVLEFEDQQLGSDANSTGNQTKYAQYQLPGGENYREVVMAMPEKPTDPNEEMRSIVVNGENIIIRGESINWKDAVNKYIGGIEGNTIIKTLDKLEAPQRNTYIERELVPDIRVKLGAVKKQYEPYTSSHFPKIPNYVAHMRLNERTDAEGNDGLFIEELQSDRHQAGRDVGYIGDKLETPNGYKIEKSPIKGFLVFDPEGNSLGSKETEVDAIQAARMNAGLSGAKMQVPDAPFRKDWSLQLFKRALRDAVESEKEWIGWTTGDTQAERYDLSKQIDRIDYSVDEDGLYSASAIKGKSEVFSKEGMELPEVEATFGKELAQKMQENKGKKGETEDGDEYRSLAGLDLKVGGEGMKGFYDTILPKEIGKYVAKMGGKVEKDAIDQSEAQYKVNRDSQPLPYRLEFSDSPEVLARFATADEAWAEAEKRSSTPIWKVNITPEMANIVSAGQLQFMPERPQDENIKPVDLQTSAKPEADAVIKPFSNALISSAGLINFLPAYHGTPFDVDKFKLANIGTGEGAQAYGWGLYFAQARAVGEGYRKMLSKGVIPTLDKQLPEIGNHISQEAFSFLKGYEDIDSAIKGLRDTANNAPDYIKKAWEGREDKLKELNRKYNEAAYWIESNKDRLELKRSEGNLYKVDIDVKDEDLLDWDKPLSEQSEKVQAILKQAALNLANDDSFLDRDLQALEVARTGKGKPLTGSDVYADIQEALESRDSKAASEYLLATGIPGIRYLDGTSRKQGQGTYNYVVFDENLITILDKNDKPVADELPTKQPLGSIQFMPQRPVGKTEPLPDFETTIIKGVTPRKGFNWKKATNVEFDIGGGKKMSFSYDPELLTEPVFKDLIKELKGQPVILLEADRQRATGGDMGGPLHPFLKSNQVTITGPDGKKYKAVWANMSSSVVSGVKNRLASHGAKYALVHLMDSIAHKSNKRTARTLDKMMRDANLNQREKEIVSLSMQAGIIAGEKAAMGASIGALKRQISQAKGNQEKIQIINEKINKIKQERDDITPKGIYGEIFNIVSGIKTAHSNVKTGLWKESSIEKANKKLENYVKSKEYKELLKNNKSLYISDNIGNTFNNRGSAIESILSFKFGKFDPSYVMRESSDFKEGENLDIVTAVELSQNPDIFALYFGNDPKEEAAMSTAERKARDEMRANPDFVEHEAYDWVMLGPEKGNNFLVEKPVKPEEIFKKYRETHAGKSVVEGSDETVVGAMRKNSGFILRVDEDTQAVVASKKKKK